MTDVLHKEKMFVEDKEIKGCSDCHEVHRKVFFTDNDRTKGLIFAGLSESVFTGFEAGKTYWIEIREVSSSGSD